MDVIVRGGDLNRNEERAYIDYLEQKHNRKLKSLGNLALRALQGDVVATMSATGENKIVHEALWLPLTSIALWTLIFVIACLTAQRRTTARH